MDIYNSNFPSSCYDSSFCRRSSTLWPPWWQYYKLDWNEKSWWIIPVKFLLDLLWFLIRQWNEILRDNRQKICQWCERVIVVSTLNEQFFSNTFGSWWEQVIFNEMAMKFTLYLTNMFNWIFIALFHRNNSLQVHMSLHWHIILIPSQPALTS